MQTSAERWSILPRCSRLDAGGISFAETVRSEYWEGAAVRILAVLALVILAILGIVGSEIVSFRWVGSTTDVSPSNSAKPANNPKLERLIGKAKALDGDTIEIGAARIRLFGIDAPENGQTCTVKRKPFHCDRAATSALREKISGQIVECEPKDVDRYMRVVAVCFVQGEDINAWMVGQGWALAYRQFSRDYISQERRAAAAKVGMWQGQFEPPWDWRSKNNQLSAENTQSDAFAAVPKIISGNKLARSTDSAPARDCTIKGNINDGGERIYHVPGDKFYTRTVITLAKGERWFCSESEARSAGWRRAPR